MAETGDGRITTERRGALLLIGKAGRLARALGCTRFSV